MNEIQNANVYSLQTAPKASSSIVANLLAQLFSSLKSGDAGLTGEARMVNYLETLCQFEEPVLRKVIRFYCNGLLGDGKFVPEAGEIANECRKEISKDLKFRNEQKAIKDQIERNKKFSDISKAKTDESRKRVAEKLKQAQETIAQAKLEMEEHELQKRKGQPSQYEITQKHFFDQGRKALLNAMENRS